MPIRGLWILLLQAGLLTLTFGEEGMWTFDNPPLAQMKAKYGFAPSREWLDHIRLSSVRLNDGGSGSFVSSRGLLLTNHHVARGQLQKNSTAEHDYIEKGFYAATTADEMKSPDLEVNVLMSMEDVTPRVMAALKGAANSAAEFAKRKAVLADIERESQEKTKLRSDVVTLYQGGEYWLYRYKKYTDVRLVFAPEQQAAFFGGDPDNFTYPRHDLDMALFRIYEDGKPVVTPQYLKWNPKGAADGDLVFVSGHPGSTERQDTTAQLMSQRDVEHPALLKMLHHRVEVLRKYSSESPEHARQASSDIFEIENGLKALEGELTGLSDAKVMIKKQRDEEEFRARVMANPKWKSAYSDAWTAIADAQKKSDSRVKERYFHSTSSDLANYARLIVQYVAEIKKPDGERLPEYRESQLESLRFQMASSAPVYRDLETAKIAGALEQDLAEAGPGDPFVKIVLAGGKSPKEAATALVAGSKLDDPAVRKRLMDGGQAAVAASDDSMIVMALKVDPLRRELIKWTEDTVQSVIQRYGEQLGKARFEAYGKTAYPDATFTLRLSYGQVKGYPMNGTKAPPMTTLYGLWDRAASFNYQAPYNLPSRFAESRGQLDLSTPLNFVTSNDIIGGNSGSPVIDRNANLVGLVFDGNIESLIGNYVYDGETNRTVAVHTAAMTEALRKLYHADALLKELLPGS